LEGAEVCWAFAEASCSLKWASSVFRTAFYSKTARISADTPVTGDSEAIQEEEREGWESEL
jgi:hypothetical protein